MHSLTLNYRIKAPAKSVCSHFQEFEKFGALHPLFTKVTRTGENLFLVNESVLLFGFLPMKPAYSVEVFERDGTVCYRSNVRKGVELEILFRFEEKGGFTTITEQVDVKANRLIASILLSTIEKAHNKIFRNLEELILNG